jgi:hypothetical protein
MLTALANFYSAETRNSLQHCSGLKYRMSTKALKEGGLRLKSLAGRVVSEKNIFYFVSRVLNGERKPVQSRKFCQ